ncbi:MAG: hypothetical protein ABIN94_15060 [Ferruginibacter sp.]
MIDKIIPEIDNIVIQVKAKDNSHSFNKKELLEFEFIFFLTMDIVRYEIVMNQKLSDLTSIMISQMFAFQCFEFYYRDYPELFSKTTDLFALLCQYNVKLLSHELDGSIEAKSSSWLAYFNEALQKIL